MARPNPELIDILRKTAKRLKKSPEYQWGHMGSCNCGHLAQEITDLDKKEIHQRAMMRYGDWSEQLNDYCPHSGLPLDKVITVMLEKGLDPDDLRHLERLSDQKVLRRLPEAKRYPSHNNRNDVILYFNTWADLLEEQLIETIRLPAMDYQLEIIASS